MVPDVHGPRRSATDIVLVYSTGSVTGSPLNLPTNGRSAWYQDTYEQRCAASQEFVLVLERSFRGRQRPRRAQPVARVDPWMPRAAAPAPIPAWPAQLRRFRGNT